MKILFVSHSSERAGAEQSLVHLVSEAVSRGHEGIVTVPDRGPLIELLTPFAKAFPVVVVRTHLWMGRRYSIPVGTVKLVQAMMDLPAYLRLLKEHHFDGLVVNSSVTPAPLLAGQMMKIPRLLIVRESFMTNPMLRSAVPKRLIRRLLSIWSTEVVTISNYIKSQYLFPSTVIYPQVANVFLESPPMPPRTSEYDEIRAVMFGTISPEKGQFDAVEAVRMARYDGAQVTLDIFGHGTTPDLLKLKSRILEIGLEDVVRVHEPTSDVLSAYHTADFSLVCSRNEAFGKVTAESVLAGRPVVAYDCGATPEILAQGGGICTMPNPVALSEAIVALCADEKRMRRVQHEAAHSGIRKVLATTAARVLDRVEELKHWADH